MNRDTTGVGSNNRAWLADGFNAFEQRALDGQVLHHRLEDKITILELRQIIIEVADGYECRSFRSEKGCGLRLLCTVETILRDAIAHRATLQRQSLRLFLRSQFAGRDVQQQGWHSCVSQVGSDLCPHCSRPQHRRLLNPHHSSFPLEPVAYVFPVRRSY